MLKLGFGCMRLPITDPDNPTSINDETMKEMADLFTGQGFTYYDTAYMYHEFESERAVGRNVVKRFPRDSFTLASKMPLSLIKNAEQVPKIFQEQKEKTGIDYFDYYLLHNMTLSKYLLAEKLKIFDYLKERKAAGEIRYLGFSTHDNAAVVDRILTEHPELEFVQLQINYLDWESNYIQSRLCYETCVKHGKPVVVMEPVKGGTLANLPKEAEDLMRAMHPDWSPASWAIRFAASLENVMVVLSGMSNLEQMQDNVSYMKDFQPLNEDELNILWQVRDLLKSWYAIPCTSCRYCVETNTCPKNLAIPNYFSLYNVKKQAEAVKGNRWSQENLYYENYIYAGYGRASDCISCRACESVCPQNLKIADLMKSVSASFDGE